MTMNSIASPRLVGKRRDRLLYAAILLPCVALAGLAILLNERDSALALKRVLEERQRVGGEVSRALVDQLQGIITSELAVPPGRRYVEDATAFVARFDHNKVIVEPERSRFTAPDARAALDRLRRDAETLSALRGALGEPRIVAYDSARFLIAAKFDDAERGSLIGVRTQDLARAAGVALGDSMVFLDQGKTGTLLMGDGIEGLFLGWRNPPTIQGAWKGPRLYYIASIGVVAMLGLVIVYFAARDLERESHAAQLRQHFVAGVSHELRTPLTAIRVMAETLHDRELPAEARRDYLATMVGETGRLSRLVDNVVEFTRLENGERIYRIRDSDLGAVIRRTVQSLGYALEKDGFRLTVHCPEVLDGVRLDDDAIEQVLLNLLTNAAKFSGDSRQIEIRVNATGTEVDVAVRDFGIGIAPGEQQRIFERFYRSPAVTSDVPGTGLGLTLARHIVLAHGGRLTVESRLGEGSVFHMHLPRARAS